MTKIKVEVEPYYKKQAVEFIDFLFDNKILDPDLTRKQISYLDDYLGDIWQININSAINSTELLNRFKDK